MTSRKGVSHILGDLEYGKGESVGQTLSILNTWFVVAHVPCLSLLSLSCLETCWCVYKSICHRPGSSRSTSCRVLFQSSSSAWIWNRSVICMGCLRRGQQPHSPFLLPSFQSRQKEVQPYLNHEEQVPRRSRCWCILTRTYSSSVLLTRTRVLWRCLLRARFIDKEWSESIVDIVVLVRIRSRLSLGMQLSRCF